MALCTYRWVWELGFVFSEMKDRISLYTDMWIKGFAFYFVREKDLHRNCHVHVQVIIWAYRKLNPKPQAQRGCQPS